MGVDRTARGRISWALLAAVVAAQVCYPLTGGTVRDRLVVLTIGLGFALSVGHAATTGGRWTATALVAVTAGGGLAVESLGVATGIPFGGYDYTGDLGPRLFDVPLVIPLAWTWMAWPAWLAAGRITRLRVLRVVLAGVGLAAWDLFLDPQMVAEGYWTWDDPSPALPGVPGIPVGNYLGWLLVSLAMMTLLAVLAPLTARADRSGPDRSGGPMHALYLWTYASQVLAHAVFLGLPASAGWGGLGMAVTAVPLAVTLARGRAGRRQPTAARLSVSAAAPASVPAAEPTAGPAPGPASASAGGRPDRC